MPAPVKPKQPSSAAQLQAQKPQPPPSPAALLEAWQKATLAQKKGDVVEAKVIGITEAGLVVQMRPLKGAHSFLHPANAGTPMHACIRESSICVTQ